MRHFVKEVLNEKEMNDFVRLPYNIYKDNPCYVPDLESDVRAFFDPSKNPDLASSDVVAYVVYDYQGKAVGRVAGIINHKANVTWNTHYVRFGMIEFVDDPEVSRLLIQAVERWGASLGMTRIQGPMGITDFDKEGMLVEDFDKEGSMVTLYNPAYYPKHLQEMGFAKEADWLQVRFDVPRQLPRRFERSVRVVHELYDLHIHKLTATELTKGDYGQRIFQLLNKAYRPLFGFSEISPATCKKFIDQYLRLADLRLIPVIEDKDGKIVATAITMGSLSHALRRSRGRMFPMGWFHLLRALKWKHEEKVEMLLVAVDPTFQGMGINALIFEYLIKVYNELGYTWAETAPMLETNTKVLTQWKQLGATFYKRRRCFGKEIEILKNIEQ